MTLASASHNFMSTYRGLTPFNQEIDRDRDCKTSVNLWKPSFEALWSSALAIVVLFVMDKH